MIGRFASALRILWQYGRIGLIRKSQFRVESFNQVLMDFAFYVTHVLMFELVFGLSAEIAGWRMSDVRILLAFYFVSDAFMMVFLGQAWHFGDDLKKGNLDPFRVRPGSPIVLYFFQRFSIEGAVNMAIASGYLVYALVASEQPLSPWWPLLVPWAAALACWARTVTTVLFSTAELYLLNSDLGRLGYEFFDSAADKPLDIFARRVQQFFLWLVPLGMLAYLPAAMVLGRVSLGASVLHSAWMLGFGLATFRFWRASFRRYESAMG